MVKIREELRIVRSNESANHVASPRVNEQPVEQPAAASHPEVATITVGVTEEHPNKPSSIKKLHESASNMATKVMENVISTAESVHDTAFSVSKSVGNMVHDANQTTAQLVGMLTFYN